MKNFIIVRILLELLPNIYSHMVKKSHPNKKKKVKKWYVQITF